MVDIYKDVYCNRIGPIFYVKDTAIDRNWASGLDVRIISKFLKSYVRIVVHL